MPREQVQPRQSGRQRRFSDLAQVLQLQEGIAQPGREDAALAERGRNNNINAALQLLGLHQQGETSKSQLDVARDRSLVDAATIVGESNPGLAQQILGGRFPEVAQGQAQLKADAVQAGVGKMRPQVSAIYGSGTDPAKMKPMLDALQASNPDAFNALPWNELNAGMKGSEVAGPPPVNAPDNIPGRAGGAVRQLPQMLAQGGAAIPQAVGGGITDFIQGAVGFNDDTRRSINDLLHNLFSAPAEGVLIAKEKLTKKR